MNKILLNAEGFAGLALSLYIYGFYQFSWILFVLLLYSPDVSMIGYVINQKLGAILYNVFHTYVLSIACVFCGLLLTNQLVLAIGLIWSAHIGMDRMFGYGLKYPTNFKDTHLHRV
ncbi:DUF4260 domain-containing protein [Jeotgalibacillus sp. ET6]|uniref:DUF4260 domain-containing protein n=1 Tax=Jeotgalibacillus sp. ET6 TaxID=3037260 RepID=UPI0024186B5D|nr:DUF4260 domain-containing protein [Jeotgalibacillus sp. ET6]MDG5472011.1 DUF4260 domain-containing protein [Jeotgalibacillus sp. ET6]